MKIFLVHCHRIFALCLAAQGLPGATFAWAAPKPATRRAMPVKVVKKPALTIVQLRNSAPVTASASGSQASTIAKGSKFVPSRFGGVSVRHVPQASPRRTTQSRPHQGIVLQNERQAPDPRDGFMADVDPSSFPHETGAVTPVKSKKAPAKITSKR